MFRVVNYTESLIFVLKFCFVTIYKYLRRYLDSTITGQLKMDLMHKYELQQSQTYRCDSSSVYIKESNH